MEPGSGESADFYRHAPAELRPNCRSSGRLQARLRTPVNANVGHL
jgi:hypothetical protein